MISGRTQARTADQLELADMARPQSLIAAVEICVCSICDKAFGSDYSSCMRHISCGRVNRCRELGATVKRLTNIVSRHDRNVGGRQAHLQPEPASAAPGPAHNPQADSDSDSDADRCDSDVGAPAGYPHSYPFYILKYPYTYP
jgi:hypothetical protein